MAKNGTTAKRAGVLTDLGKGTFFETREDGRVALVFDPNGETLPGKEAGGLYPTGRTDREGKPAQKIRANDMVASHHAWHGAFKLDLNVFRNPSAIAAGQGLDV